ncbi:cell adhesion molecule CEACAM21-like isoform X1 [Mixophyes fleayi]|uniref:cell adhesion molecule CEACAM21-like isoform X1 n=1 Tax=Mixophyes fleayi TaxID=3061075 RepID=UPI003F4E1A95
MICNNSRNRWQRLSLMTVLMCIQVKQSWCQISITMQPLRPTVGGDVKFLVKTGPIIHIINWYRGSMTYNRENILTHSPGSEFQPTTGPRYTGRETVKDDGSMVISNLAMNYSGKYTLQLSFPDSLQERIVELTVYPAYETTLAPSKMSTLADYHPNDITTNPRIHVANATLPMSLTSTRSASVNTIAVGTVIGVIVGAVVGCIIVVVLVWMTKHKRFLRQEPIYEDTEASYRKHPLPDSHAPDVPVNINSSIYQELTNTSSDIYHNASSEATLIYNSASYSKCSYMHLNIFFLERPAHY